jgi:hypothetical protein
MDEHVVPALTLNEAEALGSVEPFDCTFFFHKPSPEKARNPIENQNGSGAFVLLTSQIVSQHGIRFNRYPVTADYSALTLFSFAARRRF